MTDIRISFPMLIQNKKQFLGSAECKNWQKTFSSSLHDFMDNFCELLFPFVSLLMNLDSICALYNKHIDFAIWKFSRLKMSVLLSTVISSVQYLDSIDLDQEHGCSKNMARTIAGESNTLMFSLLMIVEDVNFV